MSVTYVALRPFELDTDEQNALTFLYTLRVAVTVRLGHISFKLSNHVVRKKLSFF